MVRSGERRDAAVRSGKKAEGWKSGCDVLEENFRGPAVRKSIDQRRRDSQKVIRVARRLAAQPGGRPVILTGILAGHGPGDKAERERNGKNGRYQHTRAGPPMAVSAELPHDRRRIWHRNRLVNVNHGSIVPALWNYRGEEGKHTIEPVYQDAMITPFKPLMRLMRAARSLPPWLQVRWHPFNMGADHCLYPSLLRWLFRVRREIF